MKLLGLLRSLYLHCCYLYRSKKHHYPTRTSMSCECFPPSEFLAACRMCGYLILAMRIFVLVSVYCPNPEHLISLLLALTSRLPVGKASFSIVKILGSGEIQQQGWFKNNVQMFFVGDILGLFVSVKKWRQGYTCTSDSVCLPVCPAIVQTLFVCL